MSKIKKFVELLKARRELARGLKTKVNTHDYITVNGGKVSKKVWVRSGDRWMYPHHKLSKPYRRANKEELKELTHCWLYQGVHSVRIAKGDGDIPQEARIYDKDGENFWDCYLEACAYDGVEGLFTVRYREM